jgi:hypothetical protein
MPRMRIASRIRSVPSASELPVYSGEAHGHVALGREVVNLIRLNLLHQANEVRRVGDVAVVQVEPRRVFVRRRRVRQHVRY